MTKAGPPQTALGTRHPKESGTSTALSAEEQRKVIQIIKPAIASGTKPIILNITKELPARDALAEPAVVGDVEQHFRRGESRAMIRFQPALCMSYQRGVVPLNEIMVTWRELLRANI